MSKLRVIEIRPNRGGWSAFEAPGVEPYYKHGPRNGKDYAISYATQRLDATGGEIRVLDSASKLEETIIVTPIKGRI